MTATTLNAPKVGDVFLYSRGNGEEPLRLTVAKITKGGWVKLGFGDGSETTALKPRWPGNFDCYEATGRRKGVAYPFTPEREKEMKRNAAEHRRGLAERVAENKRHEEAVAASHAKELAAVRYAMGANWRDWVRHAETEENGTKVVWVRMPVDPKLESKHAKAPHEDVVLVLTEERRPDFAASREAGEDRYTTTYRCEYRTVYPGSGSGDARSETSMDEAV